MDAEEFSRGRVLKRRRTRKIEADANRYPREVDVQDRRGVRGLSVRVDVLVRFIVVGQAVLGTWVLVFLNMKCIAILP